MPRYIDAEEFIEDIKTENTNLMMDGLKGTPRRMALSAKDVIERINEIPTADVQEVVRCKDCVHFCPYKVVEDFDGRCTARGGEADKDDFCNYGTKRGDETR